MAWVLLAWAASARAEPAASPAMVSLSTVGVQSAWSPSVASGDLDLLLAERLRWDLAEVGAPMGVRLLLDARFRIDPWRKPTLERHRVGALGLELSTSEWTLDLGRHPVYRGGPRLVDGVQLRYHPSGDWDLGAWLGFAPDLYTSRPALRFGGGPILAIERSWTQWSLVGEMLWADGALDRAGLLALGRVSADPTVEATARLDLQVTGAEGGSGLADGAVFLRWRPEEVLRVDALYDAYTSLRYLGTEDRDPDIRRFAARAEAAGVTEDIPQDGLDPTLYHLVGLSGTWEPPGSMGALVAVHTRYRHHEDPSRRLARVGPKLAVRGLAGERLDLAMDGNLRSFDGRLSGDAGFTVFLEPTPDRMLALDSSVRLLVDPEAYGGRPGWYADLFVDWVGPAGLVVIGGVDMLREWDGAFADVGYGAFLSVTKRSASPRRAFRSASGP
ncbi:MAG: hypothetical protein JRI25_24380 [Deltaproteobacteria bacterium]|nr:hypothetical protein [Deltaproteobacteria bacterium]